MAHAYELEDGSGNYELEDGSGSYQLEQHEIAHAVVQQTTAQTTSSTSYVDVSGAALASGVFVEGKKYLIIVDAHMGNNTSAARPSLQVLHGSTPFAESECVCYVPTDAFKAVTWFTVWTAVAGEGIKLQHKVLSGSSTTTTDTISLIAINLSDDLTEGTDWHFAERATDDALSTTPVDGALITFTPPVAGDDWLVLTVTQLDPSDTSTLAGTSMIRSGEAASSVPASQGSFPGTDEILTHFMARVFNLGNASNTFKEQAVAGGTVHTRLHSAVFALNMNKFAVHASVYTAAAVALSATDFATAIQTLAHTPSVAGDSWIGAYWTFDRNDSNRLSEQRVQVDDVDQPTGQTSPVRAYKSGLNNNGDRAPMSLSTIVNLSAAAHTIDLDGSVDSTTGTPEAEERTIWALTMELAAVAEDPAQAPVILGGTTYQRRAA